jgi:hypothetical protein
VRVRFPSRSTFSHNWIAVETPPEGESCTLHTGRESSDFQAENGHRRQASYLSTA